MYRPDLPTFCLIVFFVSAITGSCTAKKIISSPPAEYSFTGTQRVNINTADAGVLQNVPHVGPALAQKIIEHRMRYGPFRKTEHLLLVEGISDKRFREIQDLIAIE